VVNLKKSVDDTKLLVLIKDSPLVARFFQTGVRRGKKTLTWSNEKKKKFVVQII